MKCPKCSEESPGELNFCRKCGTRLATRDPESTSVITKKMIKDDVVVFPSTGSQVVALEVPKEQEPKMDPPLVRPAKKYKGPSTDDLIAKVSYEFPEESIAFTIEPRLFGSYLADAFERRGLLRLKSIEHRKGESYQLKSGEWVHIPDSNYPHKHIELLFAKDKSFQGRWQIQENPKCIINFEYLESVEFKAPLLKSTSKFVIKLKPEQYLRLLEHDPIIREITLTIERKDFQTAKKLQSAVMLDLSTTQLQGLLVSNCLLEAAAS